MTQLLAAPVLEPLGVAGVVVVVVEAVSVLGLLSVLVVELSLDTSVFFAPPPLLL
jgi:hypothetical protein